jgi:hypothetical protein
MDRGQIPEQRADISHGFLVDSKDQQVRNACAQNRILSGGLWIICCVGPELRELSLNDLNI